MLRWEPLKEEEEMAVVRDWLRNEGGAKGNITQWIEAITQETHGWPRHVHSYAEATAGQIEQSGGKMTPEGLEHVMKQGTMGCIKVPSVRNCRLSPKPYIPGSCRACYSFLDKSRIKDMKNGFIQQNILLGEMLCFSRTGIPQVLLIIDNEVHGVSFSRFGCTLGYTGSQNQEK